MATLIQIDLHDTKDKAEYQIHIDKKLKDYNEDMGYVLADMMVRNSEWAVTMMKAVEVFFQETDIPDDIRDDFINLIHRTRKQKRPGSNIVSAQQMMGFIVGGKKNGKLN